MNDFFLLISHAFASLFSANWGGVERTVVLSKLLYLIVCQTPVYPKLPRLLPVTQLALSPSSKVLGLEQPFALPASRPARSHRSLMEGPLSGDQFIKPF